MRSAKIRLFDSNSHPTVSGSWPSKKYDASFACLSKSLTTSGYRGACAVGLWGMEGYNHGAFMRMCRRDKRLIPIAGYFPQRLKDVGPDLAMIKKAGFAGIKLHPRQPHIPLDDPRISRTFQQAERLDLVVYLCAYFYTDAAHFPRRDPLYDLAALVRLAPNARVVLAHGGGVEILRYAEFARHQPKVLLDLSMTMMKYRSSSLDADLRFLFESFDQRICVGTDFPEYRHDDVLRRFQEIGRGVAPAKLKNIAYKNIERFLG